MADLRQLALDAGIISEVHLCDENAEYTQFIRMCWGKPCPNQPATKVKEEPPKKPRKKAAPEPKKSKKGSSSKNRDRAKKIALGVAAATAAAGLIYLGKKKLGKKGLGEQAKSLTPIADLLDKAQKAKDGLDQDSRFALDDYTGEDYSSINYFLRKKGQTRISRENPEQLQKTVDLIDGAFKKGSISTDGTDLFRGLALDKKQGDGIPRLGGHELKVGSIIKDDGFVSTSPMPDIAERFRSIHALHGAEVNTDSAIIKIKTSPSTKVLAGKGSEQELIVNRSSPMRVLSKNFNGEFWEIEMELIEEGGQ